MKHAQNLKLIAELNSMHACMKLVPYQSIIRPKRTQEHYSTFMKNFIHNFLLLSVFIHVTSKTFATLKGVKRLT